MIIQKPFYYIRHGQTDYNLARRYQGSMDIPLNATGTAQAHAAKDSLSGCPATHIYSSPLQRARVTADIINESLNLPLQVVDDLAEVSFGVLEGEFAKGQLTSESWKRGKTPEGAERYDDFTTRVFAALNHVLAQDSTPLIVAHGAVFWPIHEFMRLEIENTLPNAQAIHVQPDGAGWRFDLL